MRKLLLTLAEDTTDAYCRSCPFSERIKATLRCGPFDQILDIASVPMGPMLRGNHITGRRLPECLAAERAAARLVDIDPVDLNACGWDVWAPHGYDEAANRVENALADHAKKASGR